MISRKLGSMPHWAWKMNGRELAERAGDDGAPEREDAADQRRREQRERVLRREPEGRRLPELRCEQAAGDAGRERRERERPQLVRARCSRPPRAPRARSRGSTPRRGPASSRSARAIEQEHERADDRSCSGSRRCRRRRCRACRRAAGPRGRRVDVWPVKPWPPFGKLIVVSTTFTAPAAISVISAR